MPNSRMMHLFVVQVQHELLYLNTYVVINSSTEYNSYPENYVQSSLSHIKGMCVYCIKQLNNYIFLNVNFIKNEKSHF